MNSVSQPTNWYVMGPIPIPMEDPIIHTAENGYECDDPDCICHWERATQNEADDYEPPYTRADAEADLATAEYWDEIARREVHGDLYTAFNEWA